MDVNWTERMLNDLQDRAGELEQLNDDLNRNMKYLTYIRDAIDEKPKGVQGNLFANPNLNINPYDGISKVIRKADKEELEKDNRLIIELANDHLYWIQFISKCYYQNGAGIPVPSDQKQPEWNISLYIEKVMKRYGKAS